MNSLENAAVAQTLQSLHEAAAADHTARDHERQAALAQSIPFQHNWANAYLAIGPEEGRLLYLLATIAGARKIVEFGCSFGISTIYLAAAAKDNGGKVITTDLEPNKVAGTRRNLEKAGLSDGVEILQGDATQTLADIEGPVDFLFLDGAKELYLPVFELIKPKLSENVIVVADNADRPDIQPFADALLATQDIFTPVRLFGGRILIAFRKRNI